MMIVLIAALSLGAKPYLCKLIKFDINLVSFFKRSGLHYFHAFSTSVAELLRTNDVCGFLLFIFFSQCALSFFFRGCTSHVGMSIPGQGISLDSGCMNVRVMELPKVN